MAVVARIAQGGRIVIPAEYRHALGLHDGDEVIVQREGDALLLSTRREAIRRAQVLVRRYVPQGESLADELLADRRAEALRE